MNVIRGAFIGFLAGFILAICGYRWIWLEMRINVGIVIPLATFFSAAIHLRRRPPLKTLWVISLQVVFLGMVLLFYRFDLEALLVIPATLFKEGFFLSVLSLATANAVLVTAFLAGNFACLAIPGLLRTDTALPKPRG